MAQRTCGIEGCGRRHSGRGWCGAHYQRWVRYGDPLGVPDRPLLCVFPDCGNRNTSRGYCNSHARQLKQGKELHPLRLPGGMCSIPDCERPSLARRLCGKHYQCWLKHGDPLYVHTRERRVLEARKRAGKGRKYPFNEAYFDDIATEGQAYWLGFITADGCVSESGSSLTLTVQLSVRDQDHVARMCSDLGSDRPVTYYQSFAAASFGSWHLGQSLVHLGVTPRKSATVQPWNGPDHLMPHYWRGLFDGDGSIYQTARDGVWSLAQVGSEACVKGFAAWARSVCGSTGTPRQHPNSPACWYWSVCGMRKPQLLATALYGGATVSLGRKQARADELRAVDLGARKAAISLKLSTAHRQAWATGRYDSRKRPSTQIQGGEYLW